MISIYLVTPHQFEFRIQKIEVNYPTFKQVTEVLNSKTTLIIPLGESCISLSYLDWIFESEEQALNHISTHIRNYIIQIHSDYIKMYKEKILKHIEEINHWMIYLNSIEKVKTPKEQLK